MIVAARFRIHATRWKRLQRLRIEMSAVAQVPLARDDNCHPIVAMCVCLDRGVSGPARAIERRIVRKQDPAALARFFVVTIQGMRALARLKSDRRALEEVAKVALAVFD